MTDSSPSGPIVPDRRACLRELVLTLGVLLLALLADGLFMWGWP